MWVIIEFIIYKTSENLIRIQYDVCLQIVYNNFTSILGAIRLPVICLIYSLSGGKNRPERHLFACRFIPCTNHAKQRCHSRIFGTFWSWFITEGPPRVVKSTVPSSDPMIMTFVLFDSKYAAKCIFDRTQP